MFGREMGHGSGKEISPLSLSSVLLERVYLGGYSVDTVKKAHGQWQRLCPSIPTTPESI